MERLKGLVAPMRLADEFPQNSQLPQVVLRGLGDKLYDRRKTAALEVEKLIKYLAAQVTLITS